MTESNTRECADCPARIIILPGSGPKPTRCEPCRKRNRAQKQKARDAERWRLEQAAIEAERAANPPTWTCEGCSQVFPKVNAGGPAPKRCAPCGHRHKLDQATGYRRAATDARRPKNYRCKICQATKPVPNRHGPIPEICSRCQMENRRRVYRATYAAKVSPIRSSLTCPDCQQEVPLVRKGYSRRRCDPCAAARTRSQLDAWYEVRPEKRRAKNRENKRRRRIARRAIGSERFTDREIFERDGWVCGICGDDVDPTLAFPHLMSPSLDHRRPLALGGTHTRRNAQCSHFLCNSRKSNRLESEIAHLYPHLAAKLARTAV